MSAPDPVAPAPVPGRRRGGPGRVPGPLRERDFRLLWAAGLVSEIGDWLLLVSLPVMVYQLTGSTLGTSYAFLIELVPPVLLGPLAGSLADRWDRRRMMIAIGVAQGVALLPLLAVHTRHDMPILYAVIVAQSSLFAFYEPAKSAMLPTLVPAGQLVPANSLVGLNQNLGRLVGAPAGGALLAFGSLDAIAGVDAASFLVAVVLITRLRRGQPDRDRTGGRRGAGDPRPYHRAGGGTLLLTRPLPAVLVTALLGGAAQGLFVVLFVMFVARALHGDAAEIGLLRGVQAVGAVAAGLLLASLTRAPRPATLAGVGLSVFGATCLAIWNAPLVAGTWLPLYVVLFALVGAPGVAGNTGLASAVQAGMPEERRGRAIAALVAGFSLGQAAGMLAAGVLGDRVGVVPLLDVQAVLYLVAGLVAARGLGPARRAAPRPAGTCPVSPPTAPVNQSTHRSINQLRTGIDQPGDDRAGGITEPAGPAVSGSPDRAG